jgi:hypothetical protein
LRVVVVPVAVDLLTQAGVVVEPVVIALLLVVNLLAVVHLPNLPYRRL